MSGRGEKSTKKKISWWIEMTVCITIIKKIILVGKMTLRTQ